MAKGGSGDVLSGITAALLTRLSPFDALSAAAYIHGKAGELAENEQGQYSVLASDICNHIGGAIKGLRG